MASVEKSRATTEHLSQGLDRATHAVYDNADRHLVSPLRGHHAGDPPSSSSSYSGEGGGEEEGRSKLRLVSKKLKGIKTKTNGIFHPADRKKKKSGNHTTAPLLAPPPIAEAQNDRLFHDAPEQKGPDFKEVLKNPISTVQSAFHGASGAKFADTMDNQVIAHGAEVRLVRAYDEVMDAASEEEKSKATDNLEDLKKARQDSFVRWTMDRHILAVRRVPPRMTSWPRAGDFQVKGENGKGHMQWLDYGHHLLRYHVEHYGDSHIDANPNLPTPSEEALNTSLERLIMISTPYQMLLMKIRHIYRWDDPRETSQYLAVYTVLWALNYISGAAILALIWLVIKRRLYPPTLEDIREEIKRSEDAEMTPLNITQLIEQHGSHGWTDALRHDLGPWLLLQLEDFANVLEIWRNFYEWRERRRTTISLVLLTFLWLAVTMVPLHLVIKITQFNFGVMFFGLFPIATRYPQYRLLASPMKWLFWRVPTDAEWAIARLQVEAKHRKEAMRQADSKRTEEDGEKEGDVSLGKYHCTSCSHHGDLQVYSDGVRYVSAVRKNLLWELKFEDVSLLQKVGAGEGLLFVDTKDATFRVSGLKSRNEVFTQIIGYSGLRWQVSG
ncbi:MAG: hypothetical protein Q9218_002134 [Villophora microphyllina]